MDDIANTIIDDTKPNAGRIYDYLIGGSHNFAIDRQMANQLKEMAPFLPKLLKYVRWFLHKAIKRAKEQGFTQFIDFASGLPSKDHIHNNTPQGTKVIYSDIDPVTVVYGRDIIGNNPIVKFMKCNAGTPEVLVESDVVKELFGDNHKAAIGFTGICWFLKDEEISHAMKVLYEWAAEGSMLYISDGDTEGISNKFQSIAALYAKMKQPFYIRTIDKLIELIKPWKLEEPGFLLLEEWYKRPTKITEKVVGEWLTGGSGVYGGFLKK